MTPLEKLRRWQAIAERHRSQTADVDAVALREAADEIERLQTVSDMDARIIAQMARENERLRANVEQMKAAIRLHVGEPAKQPTGDHVEQLEAAMWSYATKFGNAVVGAEKARTE